ncbi:MAG: ABC transporter ATP-binding protein [Myxococcota bacterium]
MRRVRVRSVSRVFDRQFALHRVSMDLDAGSITGLVGDNGAGKTTLLNILATLDAPTSGEITYDKMTWEQFTRQARARVGWVSHDSLVYDDLTGTENLQFFGDIYGLGDLEARVSAWLDRVGLTDAADRRVGVYSRGMRQRLTLARALIHDPSLVLLDEPLTGLDQGGRKVMADVFARLREEKKIVAMITHDLSTLAELADQVAILRSGKLVDFSAVDSEYDLMEAYGEHA